jgi:hypothetical protein
MIVKGELFRGVRNQQEVGGGKKKVMGVHI